MDAYVSAMNEVSKKLNDNCERKYSKEEVIEIVFEAFNEAKVIGERQVKNIDR